MSLLNSLGDSKHEKENQDPLAKRAPLKDKTEENDSKKNGVTQQQKVPSF